MTGTGIFAARVDAGVGAFKWVVKAVVPERYHIALWLGVVRLRRACGAVLRALPGDSTAFGPPRGHVKGLQDLAAARPGDASYRELFPAYRLSRAAPVTDTPPVRPEFAPYLDVTVPAAGVAVLRSGRVVGRLGRVITANDEFVADVSPEHEIVMDARMSWSDTAITRQLRLPPVTVVEGPLGVAGASESNNYYHWVFDVLPKLHLLELSGVAVRAVAIDQRTAFQRESLDLLRFPADRIPLDEGTHLSADPLVVPSMIPWPRAFPEWVCRFLRDTFLPLAVPVQHVGPRLFVRRRGGGRVVVNEASLLGRLADLGFSGIHAEDLSFREQVGAFAAADVIVLPHGAALTNTVFCSPGTRVVEIFNPSYIHVAAWELADQLGLDHCYVLGEPTVRAQQSRPQPGRRLPASWPGFRDIEVDEQRLLSVVRRAIG